MESGCNDRITLGCLSGLAAVPAQTQTLPFCVLVPAILQLRPEATLRELMGGLDCLGQERGSFHSQLSEWSQEV